MGRSYKDRQSRFCKERDKCDIIRFSKLCGGRKLKNKIKEQIVEKGKILVTNIIFKIYNIQEALKINKKKATI